ncbi:MAG: amino acid adenylation domain-containing protein, partial [Candidatus Aminicenantes bacterium]
MKSYDITGEEKYIGGQNTRERDFWLNQLSGDFEKSFFPYDYERAANKEPQMAVVPCGFPGAVEAKLIKASTGSDSRLHMLLVAGLVLLLAKYTGTRDITIGLPIYRQEQEGDFVNTALILRHQLEDHMTFKDLLIQVRQTIAQANEHVNYPIESLPYELGMSYSPAEDFPLFDVMLLLENVHNRNYIQHFRINIMFLFNRTGEKLSGKVEYNSSLYNKKKTERIVHHYTYLLQEALFNPNRPIADISVLSGEEKKKILFVWNDTDTGYPKEMTIQQLFERQVETTPHHIAVVSGPQQVTYKKLNEQANRTAALLIEKGIDLQIKGNIIVGMMGQRSVWMVLGILGILKAGAVYLPINAKDPEERITFILEDSKAAALITQEHLVKGNPSLLAIESLGNIILYEELADEGEENIDHHVYKNRECLNKPGDNIYLIYTSGTTGKPKGVLVKQQGIVNYVWWAANQYVKNEKVNFPLYTSIAFDLTVTSLFTPLITGNAIVVYGDGAEANEALIERVMEDNQVAVVKLTPSHLKLIKDRNTNERISSVKRFILGGEQLSTQLAKDIYRAYQGKVEIYNEYGPTEAAVGCMIYQFNPTEDSADRKSVPIGKPIANTQVYLLNENLEPVPMGAVGELYISGEGLAAGYLYQPTLTAEKFIPNPFIPGKTMYRTGDLAKWLEDGNIEFLGRKDNQVKIRGYRIELAEIENCLLTHDEIREVVVVSREDYDEDIHLCAYMVSDREVPVFELREYLAALLPDYMIPAYFVTIDQVPLTRNGKIDTRALPEPRVNVGVKYIAPRDETERGLVKIWSDILSIDETELSIDVNFFEVGGHSLKATVLANKIHKNFNAKVSLESIFRFPTLRGLGEYLKKAERDDFNAIEVVEQKEYYGLSSAQKRLYVLQQMDKESTGYNVPMIKVLEGIIRMDRLESTFEKLIQRHESLRTSFELLENEPVQKVHPPFSFKVNCHAPGNQSPGEIIKAFVRPFNLAEPPLLRVELIKEKENRHILLFDMHHMITDGISTGLFIREFMAIYKGQYLPGLRVQYKDYAEWQNREKERGKIKEQEAYWLKLFAGDIPVLDLPTDYARPPLQSFAGNAVDFVVGEEETGQLNALAVKNEVTLFMLLLAICNVFLSKISGQEDIVVGTGVEGRGHEDLKNIIGMFVNSLPLRNYPAAGKTFNGFLKELKEQTLQAFKHQEYQFEDLVANLELERDTSRNPLFDVMFQLERSDIPVEIPGLSLEPYESENPATKFDLTLWVFDEGKYLQCKMEYCTKLFKQETIRAFIKYFKIILTAALNRPGQKLSGMELITEEEKNRLLYGFNDTRANYPRDKTIHRLFAEQAEKTPTQTALVLESNRMTYKELKEKSHQLARVLESRGVQSGSIVGIVEEHSFEMLICILGVLTAGGAYVSLDPGLPPERLNWIIKDSNIPLLLAASSSPLNDNFTYTGEMISPDDETLYTDTDKGCIPGLPGISKSSDLVYLIYTSGSTGKPKGVMVEHQSLVNYVTWARKVYVREESCDFPWYTSLSFDLTVTSIYVPLISGNAVVLYPGEEGDRASIIERIVTEGKVRVMKLTPSHLKVIKAIDIPASAVKLKRLIVGGEQLTAELAREICETFFPNIEIYNEYGPTEAVVGCMIYRFDPAKDREVSVPIGIPADNVNIYLLDKNQVPVPPLGAPGELWISGEGLARGYLNHPELTAEKFDHDLWDLWDYHDEKNKSFCG